MVNVSIVKNIHNYTQNSVFLVSTNVSRNDIYDNDQCDNVATLTNIVISS